MAESHDTVSIQTTIKPETHAKAYLSAPKLECGVRFVSWPRSRPLALHAREGVLCWGGYKDERKYVEQQRRIVEVEIKNYIQSAR
jgi:hypothetical protein